MSKVYIAEAQNGAQAQLLFWLLLQNLKGSTDVFEFETSGHEELIDNQLYLRTYTTWYDDYMTDGVPAESNPIVAVKHKNTELPLILFGDPVIDLNFLNSTLPEYALVFTSCQGNEKIHSIANSLFKNKYNDSHPTPIYMFNIYKEICETSPSLRKGLEKITDLNDDELLIVFEEIASRNVDNVYYLHDEVDIANFENKVFRISYTTLMTDAKATLDVIEKVTGKPSSPELLQSLKNYHAAHKALVDQHPKVYP